MRNIAGTINAELASIGKPEKRQGKTFSLLTFKNLDDNDRNTYLLYVVSGYSQSAKFTRLRVGSKIKNVKVYTDKSKYYVDIQSNIKEIKPQPLF